MKTNIKKRKYFAPEIERTLLDNEISLALESVTPPPDPGGTAPWGMNETNGPDIFKTNIG